MSTVETTFLVEGRAEHVSKYRDWLTHRGGIAVWTSVNLSNPGQKWSTPAFSIDGTPTTKPNWQAGDTPIVVTDPSQVGIYTETLFKDISVKLRFGSQGFMLKLSDASQRKVDRVLDACRAKHGNAHYRTGGLVNPVVSVYYTDKIIPLSEYQETEKGA